MDFHNKKLFIISSLLSLFFLCSCSFTNMVINGRGNIKLKRVEYANLKGWNQDDHRAALLSFLNSCNKFSLMNDSQPIGGQIADIKVADFADVCDIAAVIKKMSAKQARNFFENWFIPFEVSTKDGDDKGLFTGYYQPELKGSKVKTEFYKYPIYARPDNLDLSRAEIADGALDGKGLELIYVSDPVDLFFMHIQGSGRIILDDGEIVKLAYNGRNNFPYNSIGNYIITNDLIDEDNISYNAIKSWLKSDLTRAQEIMNINSSYIFFKKIDDENAIGAQGVPLTAERSLAIDSDILPLGYPIWLDVKNYHKLLISQDTGSAIKGTVRGDIFFGRGAGAEQMAGAMNNKGKYYILLPSNIIDKF